MNWGRKIEAAVKNEESKGMKLIREQGHTNSWFMNRKGHTKFSWYGL